MTESRRVCTELFVDRKEVESQINGECVDEMASGIVNDMETLRRRSEYRLSTINRWVRQIEVTMIQIDGRADKRGLEWAKEW